MDFETTFFEEALGFWDFAFCVARSGTPVNS